MTLASGETQRQSVLAVFIGNERSLGGNFIPCPDARPDDGRVDICTILAGTGARYLDLFRQVLSGQHVQDRAVSYLQTENPFELAFSGATPLLVDGDIKCASHHYFVDVLPGRFRIVTPAPIAGSRGPGAGPTGGKTASDDC